MQLIDRRKYSGIYHSTGSFTRPVKKGYRPPSSLLALRCFIIICFYSALVSPRTAIVFNPSLLDFPLILIVARRLLVLLLASAFRIHLTDPTSEPRVRSKAARDRWIINGAFLIRRVKRRDLFDSLQLE